MCTHLLFSKSVQFFWAAGWNTASRSSACRVEMKSSGRQFKIKKSVFCLWTTLHLELWWPLMPGYCHKCVVVCISIWMSTKGAWNEVRAQTRQLCPCHDVFIHAEAEWHHPERESTKRRGGPVVGGRGGLLYFASQAVSGFMSPKPVPHRLLPCTRALSGF